MRSELLFLSWVLALGCHAPKATPVKSRELVPVSRPVVVVSPEAPPPAAVVRASLSLVAELACDAYVFELQGRTIVWCGKDLRVVDAQGALSDSPTLATGLKLDAPGMFPPQLVTLAGRWPDAAWAATTEVSGNGNSNRLRFFRWQKERWVAAGKSVEAGAPFAWVVFPWLDGMVALAPVPFGPTRVLAVSARPSAVPALSAAVQSAADRESYPCHHALIAPDAALELSPGDVMIFAGQLCGVPQASNGTEVQARHLGVERLRAGQKRGEISLLPVPSDVPADVVWSVAGAAALSSTDALVAANGSGAHLYLAHWDGEAWQQERAPFKALTGLWAEAGVFWATDSSGASWLRRGERWLPIEWSEPATRYADGGARRDEVSQVATVNGEATWVVRREERDRRVSSRLYRVELEP